ncbi:MAG: hypothetical protein M1561_02510 [Gammaproteobacteria bacterium]|nr:hypothetical protein [Gammaproteobacteria bacterium]
MTNNIKSQRGFLAVVAIMIIVIVSLMSAALAYMYVRSTDAKIAYIDAKKSFYIAESGVDRAIYQYVKRINPCTSSMTGEQCCDALPVNNVTFADGAFDLSTNYYFPTAANLTASIDANVSITQIQLANVTGYAPSGRVLIDGEAFDYNGISGNTLKNVIRAQAGTTSTTHTTSSVAKQEQCSISAVGRVPNLPGVAALLGRRTEGVSVMDSALLGNGTIEMVGDNANSSSIPFLAYKYSTGNWQAASENSGVTGVGIYSITRSDNGVYGWVCGDGGRIWYSNLNLWGFSPRGTPASGSETWHYFSLSNTGDLASVTTVGNSRVSFAVGLYNPDYSYNIVKIVCTDTSCTLSKPSRPSNTYRANLLGVSMSSDGTMGMAVDDYGNVLVTTNSGNTWSNIRWGWDSPLSSLRSYAPLTAVKVISDTKIWINGNYVFEITPSAQSGRWKATRITSSIYHNFGTSVIEYGNMGLLTNETNQVVDGWVIGYPTFIERYQNGNWSDASGHGINGGENINVVSSSYASISAEGAILSFWNGATWQSATGPQNPPFGPDYEAVWLGNATGANATVNNLVGPYTP